jgi:hypothetical protein
VSVSTYDFTAVEFAGELTVRTIAEAHRRLSETVAAAKGVEVEIAPDADLDLSFIQLLQSGRRTARETGAGFRLARPAAGPLREMLERGGFLTDPADREFWLIETEDR